VKFTVLLQIISSLRAFHSVTLLPQDYLLDVPVYDLKLCFATYNEVQA